MRIIHDIFPARVRVSASFSFSDDTDKTPVLSSNATRIVESVRIVVTEDTVFVAADSHTGPVLIFRDKYQPENITLVGKRKDLESRIITDTGKLILFKSDDGCGCGSKLRAWNPYNTVYSTKDPTE